jgi:hypothetical protein
MGCRLPSKSPSFGLGKRCFAKFTTAAVLVLGLMRFAPVTALGQSPTVSVDGPTQIADTSAIIAVTINPNGSPTGFYVQWGSTTAYGQTGPVNIVPYPNAVTNVSAWMVGLSPGTFYHYQVVATNSAGSGYSADMTLTTASGPPPGPAPEVATGTPWVKSATNASVVGSLNPNGQDTTYHFQWGTTAAYGNTTPLQTLVAGGSTGWHPVYAELTGLSPGSTYHYRLIATNASGSAFGTDQSFTTHGLFSAGGHFFTYGTNDGTVTIIAYSGPGGDVTIPSTVTGLPVTTIGYGAFQFANVTNVTIPNGLTSIGDSAFYQCTGLASVTIPDSVTNIADSAFTFCMNLANLHLGNGLTSIGAAAFMGCGSLTRVTIPDSVTNIADGAINVGGSLGAFFGCGLTNVTIGKGLAYLGTGAFNWCQNLPGVYFHGNAPTTGVSFWGTEDIFHGSDLVKVFYLPGTTGWEPALAGVPTALWNPQAQTADGNFGVQQGRFGFNIVGTADIPIVVEASTNPAGDSWIPLQSCTLTNGSIHFTDPQWAIQPSCFYRIRSP